jgi:hypothetical protein
MTYTTLEARQQLLDALAGAAEDIGLALSALGEAYEQLDEQTAERLEEELFRPVQTAYGRAKRTYGGFAERYDLPSREFETHPPGAPSNGARGFIDSAVDTVARADGTLAALQDSLLPIEVGDPELRAGITEVRDVLSGTRARARELVRTLGR